jgi:hypothetical protein
MANDSRYVRIFMHLRMVYSCLEGVVSASLKLMCAQAKRWRKQGVRGAR